MRFLAVSLIVLCAVAGLSATYHVSVSGDDTTGTGSEGSPWRTVQKAMDTMTAGDTVLLAAGWYDEAVTSEAEGSSGLPITINGQGQATIRRLALFHSHHHVLNLSISNAATSPVLRMGRGGHDAVVSNCFITPNNQYNWNAVEWTSPVLDPWDTTAASRALFISNRITGVTAGVGFAVYGDNNLFVGNVLHDFRKGDFIRLWGRTNVFRHNVFSNNLQELGSGWHADFIQTFGLSENGSRGHILDGNLIHNMEVGQLSQLEGNVLPEISDWIFCNNIFSEVNLQASCTVPGILYLNNMFYRCNYANNAGHALSFGVRSYTLDNNWTAGDNYSHGSKVLNNVFIDCGQSSINGGYYFFNTSLTNVQADFNYVGKNGYSAMRADGSMRPIGGEVEWDNYRWYEPNGINGGNPGLADPGHYDFRLLTNSILIGAGTNLSHLFTTSFDGTPRPTNGNWSIGPFEGGSGGSPVSPPVIRAVRTSTLSANQIIP